MSLLLRQVLRHPSLKIGIPAGLVAGAAAAVSLNALPAVLAGWSAFLACYLVVSAHHMLRATPQSMLARAEELDEGSGITLAASMIAALAAIAAVILVVMDGQAMNPTIRTIYGAEQVGEQLRKLGLN